MRDVVVAGGGPVGLATALYAARAGLDVVVREPRQGVVDKACGEGLMPGAVAGLRELGVSPDGVAFQGIRYVAPGRSATADFRHGPGLGVRRTTLHTALRAAVDDAGIKVEHRAVSSVSLGAGFVDVDGERVRHLVAADGLHSSVRRRVGLSAPSRSAKRWGQRVHAPVAPWTPYVEVHWADCGEAYVTPVAPGQIGVAVLTDRPTGLADLLPRFTTLWPRLRDVELSRVRGAGPLRQRSSARVRGGVLLVGDAAGYVDALTGEGIAVGLAQARAAVAAIADGAPERYEQDWVRATRRHDLLTLGLLTATRSRVLRTAIVPAAARLPWVFGAAVNQLARPA